MIPPQTESARIRCEHARRKKGSLGGAELALRQSRAQVDYRCQRDTMIAPHKSARIPRDRDEGKEARRRWVGAALRTFPKRSPLDAPRGCVRCRRSLALLDVYRAHDPPTAPAPGDSIVKRVLQLSDKSR